MQKIKIKIEVTLDQPADLARASQSGTKAVLGTWKYEDEVQISGLSAADGQQQFRDSVSMMIKRACEGLQNRFGEA